MKRFKVLFVVPHHDTEPRIPLAVAILVSCLKKVNVDVRLFDTTFMFREANVSNKLKEKKSLVKKSNIVDFYGEQKDESFDDAMENVITEFKPDLVAMTLIEYNFILGMKVLRMIKGKINVPTLVGGIMPIIEPNKVLEQDCVDMMCIGEGEKTIVDVVERLQSGKGVEGVENLWIKKGNEIVKTPVGALAEINQIPYQDWSLFDKRCLLKAFQGKVYRCGSFEFSRGCLLKCSFCVAPAIRNTLKKESGYQRWKTPRRLVDEISFMKNKYDLELIHFCDTNFLLGLKLDYLEEFAALYKEKVDLPFMIQTGAETVNEKNMPILKEMRCVTMSIGVESGSPKIRKQVMKKKVSNDVITRCFNLAKEFDIRTTANYIIGLPYETEEDVWESIEFNKQLNPPSIAVHFFVPFVGTELYDVCVKEGFYEEWDPNANVHERSAISTNTLTRERIGELMEIFIDEYNKSRQ